MVRHYIIQIFAGAAATPRSAAAHSGDGAVERGAGTSGERRGSARDDLQPEGKREVSY